MTMTLTESVLLGVVQGVTEFFPISSSGHLVIMQGLFGLKEPQLAFDIFLHIGTLVSVLIFFRSDIRAIFGKDRRTLLMLAAASVPTFIIGFLFKDIVERYFAMPKVSGYMLIITGAWLMAAVLYSYKHRGAPSSSTKESPGIMGSLAIGFAQGIAVMPGISRSGATIATGIMTGLEKKAACRFSFLLAVPAIAGASLLKAHKITAGLTATEAVSFISGGLAAMVTGIFAIRFLLKIVGGDKLYIFGIYCFLAGLVTIILL